MKNLLPLLIIFLSMTGLAKAQSVDLAPVVSFQIDTCIPAPANTKPLNLVEVAHRGEDEAVGFIQQGTQQLQKVYSTTDVKEVIKESVRNALTKCGYKFANTPSALRLKVNIDDFSGGARNKMLVGKGTNKLALDLELLTADENSHYNFRFANETTQKGISTKKLKRLAKSLNELLVDVMKQLAGSKAFGEGVSDLSRF